MSDIFGYNRSAKPEGVFSLNNSRLNISGGESTGYMVQNWRTNYQQAVREIFEIGSDSMYWSKGRPQGSGEIGRIVGSKRSGAGLFPSGAFDMCEGGAMMTLYAKGGACPGSKTTQGVRLRMDGVIVSSIGHQMQVGQDIQLNENIGWRFAWMQLN